MDGGAGDPVALSQLSQTLAPLTVSQDGSAIKLERFASDVPAFEPGAAHAGTHSLDDQVAFEFRDGSDDDYDRPA